MNGRARPRPTRRDVVTAAATGALALAGLPLLALMQESEPTVSELPDVGAASWWAVVVLLVAQAVTLAWAARVPRGVLVAVAALPIALALAAPSPAFGLTSLAVLVATFLATLRVPLGRLRMTLPAAYVLVTASQAVNDAAVGAADSAVVVLLGALVQALGVVGVPLVVALFVVARRDARRARRGELTALEREHDALLQAAVSRERAAMSRELHDIAAHHLSGMALMAAAIHRQVDSDPEAAKRAALQVRAQSTEVLDDLRRLVGLLRDDGPGPRAVETLAAVQDLVDARRAVGTEVELEAGPEPPGGIGPLSQLVAFRMVQEALANATTHAPGARCTVQLDDQDPDHLVVLVRNTRPVLADPGPGGGFGLLGMRERAELVGARLSYGATPDGGWQVRLEIPRDHTLASDAPTRPPEPA